MKKIKIFSHPTHIHETTRLIVSLGNQLLYFNITRQTKSFSCTVTQHRRVLQLVLILQHSASQGCSKSLALFSRQSSQLLHERLLDTHEAGSHHLLRRSMHDVTPNPAVLHHVFSTTTLHWYEIFKQSTTTEGQVNRARITYTTKHPGNSNETTNLQVALKSEN